MRFQVSQVCVWFLRSHHIYIELDYPASIHCQNIKSQNATLPQKIDFKGRKKKREKEDENRNRKVHVAWQLLEK